MNMTSEPIIIINSVTAAIEAIIVVLVAFGFSLSGDQVAAIMGAVVAVGAILSTVVGRASVFAPDTVAELVASGGE